MTQARDAAFVAGCFVVKALGLACFLYIGGGFLILPPSVLLGVM